MIPLGDDQGKFRFVATTVVLSAGLLAAFIYQWSLSEKAVASLAASMGLVVPDVMAALRGASGLNFVLHGLVPMFFHSFLHAGPIHVASCVVGLWAFGARLESRTSWWRFLLFFAVCTVLGGVAQLYLDPKSDAAHLGATVPVGSAGLVYWLLHTKARIRLLILPLPMIVWAPSIVAFLIFATLQFHKVQECIGLGCGVSIGYVPQLAGVAVGGLIVGPVLLGPRRRPSDR